MSLFSIWSEKLGIFKDYGDFTHHARVPLAPPHPTLVQPKQPSLHMLLFLPHPFCCHIVGSTEGPRLPWRFLVLHANVVAAIFFYAAMHAFSFACLNPHAEFSNIQHLMWFPLASFCLPSCSLIRHCWEKTHTQAHTYIQT